MKNLFALILLIAVTASLASAKTKTVRIYFVPWSMSSFANMNAEHVRKRAFVKTEILDPSSADAFVAWLGEDKMKEDPRYQVEDIRLVIDAEQDDGTMRTFVASRFAISALSSGKVRIINDSFRAAFNYFYEEGG